MYYPLAMIDLESRRNIGIDYHKSLFLELGLVHDQRIHDEVQEIIERAEAQKLSSRIASLLTPMWLAALSFEANIQAKKSGEIVQFPKHEPKALGI